jgi:hypothetical protein
MNFLEPFFYRKKDSKPPKKALGSSLKPWGFAPNPTTF